MFKPLVAVALCAAAGMASAQYGLQWGKPVADHTAQVALAGWTVGLRVQLLDGSAAPLGLFGDRYLTGPGFGEGKVSGGLRLSGGLTVDGWHAGHMVGPVAGRMAGLDLTRRAAPGAEPGWAVQPYVGVGYTSLSARAGWGFAADIGLGGLRPGTPLRLGHGGHGGRGGAVEQLLDDLRLAPVLQLGVSYAF